MSAESDYALNKAIAKGFKECGKKVVNKVMKTHLKKYAKELQGDSKSAAPTDTNELKQKIKVRVGKRSTVAANYQVGVSVTDFKELSPKASVQEYGSPKKGIKEQSFMRRPFDSKAESIATRLQKDIIADIETELKK
jgi:hypothetical protein